MDVAEEARFSSDRRREAADEPALRREEAAGDAIAVSFRSGPIVNVL